MRIINMVRTALPLALLPIAFATVWAGTPIAIQMPLDGIGATASETSLGDFVADAVRQQSEADAAIVLASELRPVVIAAGVSDSDKIVGALSAPTDRTNTVVILKITGRQLRRAFEHALSRAPSPFDGFLQVSGIHINFDSSKPAALRISDLTIGGRKVEPDRTYMIATTRRLADGALGYFDIWTHADMVKDTQAPLSATVAAYAASRANGADGSLGASRPTVDAHVEGRIIGK